MAGFFRNTTLGSAVRFVSHDKYLSFAIDTKKYNSNEQSTSVDNLESHRKENKDENMPGIEVDWYVVRMH